MPLDLARLEAIFSEALGKPTAAERAAFLDRACGGDPDLRRRVERLLASHQAAGSFLGPPAADPGAPTGDPLPFPERPGGNIGRYKLLELLGMPFQSN